MKRPNNSGSLSWSEHDQRWVAAVKIDGKWVRRYCLTYEEGERKLRDLLNQRDSGALRMSPDQTLAVYLATWIRHMESRVRGQTLYSYRHRLGFAVEHQIGTTKLRDLRVVHFNRLYDDLLARTGSKALSPSTVRMIHTALSAALQDAVEEELLTKNPVSAAHPPRPETPKTAVYTREQLQKLWDVSEGTRWHALWVILGILGLRIGEALTLRWDDLDEERHQLRVERTQTYDAQGHRTVGPTKTASSLRTLDLYRPVERALKRHRAIVNERRLKAATWHEEGWIFPNKTGRMTTEGVARQALYADMERAGLPRIRAHDLRHTAATLLLEDGEHPQAVQKMLGHAGIGEMYDRYSHVTARMRQSMAERVERLYGQ